MDRVLEGMNYGRVIRQITKCLYTNIESAILSNGNLSYFFNVHRERLARAVHALSPLLFVLISEVLA